MAATAITVKPASSRTLRILDLLSPLPRGSVVDERRDPIAPSALDARDKRTRRKAGTNSQIGTTPAGGSAGAGEEAGDDVFGPLDVFASDPHGPGRVMAPEEVGDALMLGVRVGQDLLRVGDERD